MAAYYHTHPHHGTNTEIHQDHNSNNFHTLILMNPNLADSHHHHHQPPPPPQQQPQSHNMLLLNSAAATVASTLSPPPVQPFLGHPHQFAREPNNITLYGYPPQEARDIPRARQGLSLTLSSQHPSLAGGPHHDGGPGEGGLVLGSKYLKAAQELLEEVVHVSDDSPNYFKPNNNNNNNNTDNSPKKGNKGVADSPSEEPAGGGGSGGGRGGGGSGGGAQLSTAERQEVQMKKAKLVTMLDEAEQRYRHYNHQMQIVIESFEQAAGMGSAKTYTALALKTISKQFRCLKDAIQAQIRAANKILGDDHEGGSGSSAGGKIEGSRLKYIDHQIRQQRALQQLGMIQNPNAWRPQRGLPERSVSVLRAWLFEHFLHPYPKDSDKIMLAKQTGLTRSQVSNWFINARVRLWKPMIEEMYMEEIKEQEQNNGLLSEEKLTASNKETSNNEDNNATTLNQINNQDKVTIAENHHQLIKTCKDQQHNAPPPPHPVVAAAAAENNNGSSFMSIPQTQHGFTLTSSLEMEGGISHRSPKRHRNDDVFHYNNGNNNNNSNNGEILIKFGNEKQGRDAANGNGNGNGYPIISGGMNFIGGGDGLGGYPIGEIGRFETEDFSAATPRFLHGNGISLSLGLPPSCENQQQHQQQQQLDNLSATNHSFISANNPNIQFRRTNEFGSINNNNNPSSAAAAFDCIDMQNRKGFAAQLLPDFVT